jgi:hypothetical protein
LEKQKSKNKQTLRLNLSLSPTFLNIKWGIQSGKGVRNFEFNKLHLKASKHTTNWKSNISDEKTRQNVLWNSLSHSSNL